MVECDICYNSFISLNLLRCCKGKRMCLQCKNNYNNSKCPFCRQNMNRKETIIIINKNFPYPNGDVIMSIMNYNIIKIS